MKTLYCGIALAIHATITQAEPLPAVDCILNPSQEIDLSSYVPGVLTQVYVTRGQTVTVGEPIAEIDSRVEVASVVLAEARADIQSELESSRINLGYDRLSHRRLSDLYSSRAVSEQDKEQTERAVKLASATLKQAQELQRIRELELKRAQALLEQRTVRSPIAGVIQRNLKHIGEYVDEEPIVRVVSLDPLTVETMVPIQLFGKIVPGMQAEVFAEIDPHTSRKATVVAVDPVGDVGSSAFGIQLTMANPEQRLPAGIKCDLRFLETPPVVERTATAPAVAVVTAPAVASEGQVPQPQFQQQALQSSQLSLQQYSQQQVQLQSQLQPQLQPRSEPLLHVASEPAVTPGSAPTAFGQLLPAGSTVVKPVATAVTTAETTVETTSAAIAEPAPVAITQAEPAVTEDAGELLDLGLYPEAEAEQLMARLNRRQVRYQTESVSRIERVGYIVLLGGEQQLLLHQVESLQRAGVRDVAYMAFGPYKGHVSLGVFYSTEAAQQRVSEIAGLGYQPQIRERRKRKHYVQISVDPLADDRRLADLQR